MFQNICYNKIFLKYYLLPGLNILSRGLILHLLLLYNDRTYNIEHTKCRHERTMDRISLNKKVLRVKPGELNGIRSNYYKTVNIFRRLKSIAKPYPARLGIYFCGPVFYHAC